MTYSNNNNNKNEGNNYIKDFLYESTADLERATIV